MIPKLLSRCCTEMIAILFTAFHGNRFCAAGARPADRIVGRAIHAFFQKRQQAGCRKCENKIDDCDNKVCLKIL